YSDDAPSGIAVSGTLSCLTVNGGVPIVEIPVTALGVGAYTIDGQSCSGLTLQGQDLTSYSLVYTGVTAGFLVQQAPQEILFTPPASAAAGTSLVLSATGGPSGNAIVFSIELSSAAICQATGADGATLELEAPGACVVDANQGGSYDYSAAPRDQQTIEVTASQTAATTTTTNGPTGGQAGGGGTPPVPSPTTTTSTTRALSTGTTSTTVATSGLSSLPAPPFAPPGTYGQPDVTSVGAVGLSLSALSEGAEAVLTIPAGALPPGTLVGLFHAVATSRLGKDIPRGRAYLASFAVAWTSSRGAPAAHHALTLTIDDHTITPRDVIYVITRSGVRLAGSTARHGSISVRFTQGSAFLLVQVPVVTALVRSVTTKQLTVELICQSLINCAGSLSLRGSAGGRASGARPTERYFALKAGASERVVLPIAWTGAPAPRQSGPPRQVTLLVMVEGGGSTNYRISLP
ncbi:MAG TPA: hypothetical protein VME46_26230, partial [Acidimicrobiales bacterium]|nr:hypothetical protein [Acidimicrobiales bacterium]